MMNTLCWMAICVCLLTAAIVNSAQGADERLGGMRLLDGYEHQPLQGIDSIVGKISKKDGLVISYEIGSLPKPGGLRFGGQFSDRPTQVPKDQLRWYREQTVNGQPVHLAYRKDDVLLVSFPKKGMNLTAKIRSAEEMADALLMILTYPNPPVVGKPK